VSFLVIDRITSEVPPFDMMGGVTEPEVAIWIPVIAWRDGLPHHLAVFVPYIWLDNSMSIATGREMYGYPKAFGTHTVTGEKTAPDTLELKVYGMDYSPTATPEMNLLISVKATTPLEAVPAGPGPRAFAEQLISQATARLATQSAPAAAAAFRAAAAADFTAPTIRQLFLRQFRAAEDGTLAALQQIMEVPAKVHPGATGSLLPRRYQLTAHPLDSHPLAADLGLVGTLDVELAWRVLMDFTVEPGTVIWPTRTLA
jgi:hypothetical protein